MYRKHSHQSELVAFSIVLVVLGIFLLIDFLLSFASQKYVIEIIKQADFFKNLFPEGQPLFNQAKKYAYMAYEIKKEFSKHYQSNVQILLAFLKGEFQLPKEHLIFAWFSKYMIGVGIIKGAFLKGSKFSLLAYVSFLSVVLIYLLRKPLRKLYLEIKARIYDPFGDEDIRKVLKILIANPVPASISHHLASSGGLFKHSLSVAIETADSLPEPYKKEGFLAALLHDIGKIKIYKTVCNEKCSFWKLNISQEKANKLMFNELEKRFNVKIPENQNVWDIVKETDRKVTGKELKEANFKVDKEILIEALSRLNINGIESSKYDGWYKKELPFVIVLAHALNTEVSKILLEKDPLLPLSTQPDMRGVHVIAYTSPYDEFLIKEIEGKKAEDLGLFDAKVGVETFKAVYLIKKEIIPKELLLRWGDTNFFIEIKQRKN